MDEQTQKPSTREQGDVEYVVVQKKRKIWNRVGCWAIVLTWFLVLLIPLVFFILAIEGDITIKRSGVPDSYEHPLLQLSLIMESDARGLRVTNTSLHHPSDNNLCVQTNVRFLLWEGDGDSASFCDCYTRSDEDADWVFETYSDSACDVD